MSSIKFGPAGMGPVKKVEKTFERYNKKGIKACEIPFTYQVYIKRKEDATRIRKAAKKFGIELSAHAPYWINLNSEDKEKIKGSEKRILDSCRAGHWLGVKRIVFHAGFYEKNSKEETYLHIKERIIGLQKEIKKNKWNVKLAPETMGKINVFGSAEEIHKLVEETGCYFCIDFAHVLAREKKIDFEKLKRLFPQKSWHCHFSGIEYNEKGEKHHKKTSEKELKELISNLPKEKNITIINESPSPVWDSTLSLKIYNQKIPAFYQHF